MINYEAKDVSEYLETLEKELKLKQIYELETAKKLLEINKGIKKEKINKSSLTDLKKLVSSSTSGNSIKKIFGKLSLDFSWRTLFVYYCENDQSFLHLKNTNSYKKEKEGINLTWEAIKGDSPFEKIYNNDIYSPFLLMNDLPFINDILNTYLFINGWNSSLYSLIPNEFTIKELRAIVQRKNKNNTIKDDKNEIQLKSKIIHETIKFSKNNEEKNYKNLIKEVFLSYNINSGKIENYLRNINFENFENILLIEKENV